MRSVVPIVVLCLLFYAAIAEEAVWYEGSVVLRNDEVLRGRISVEPVHDLILFSANGQLMVYPAARIKAFYFYDAKANINRKFVSLRQRSNAFTADHLYEIVVYGEARVLRRIASKLSDPDNDGDGYRYYVQADGNIVPFRKFRSEVYPALLRHSGTVETYVSENKLQPGNSAHIILIVAYYNKALSARSPLASQ